ncbi:MAG: aspartate aminotransferase family protein [Calditrichaeota bacterium]|nr:aspartate aminotransferase family protein [Calditrichota bacterium]
MGRLSADQVFLSFSQFVSSGKVQFFKNSGIDFVLGKRETAFLFDLRGEKRLIDCHCNGGVFNLGHRNPEIISALEQSLRELDIGNHHLISEQRALLAEKLAQLMPGDIQYTVFGVSGGEAIDLSIKVARGYTHREKIISAKGGYHGHTGFALAAGDEKYRAPFGPMPPGFQQIPFNDVPALEKNIDENTAAVIFETIPATLGMPIPDSDYFQQAREICDSKGALMIMDEVQSGLGRTGKLWAIEHFDFVPDIVVIGKGLSGGIYPMSATCFRPELEQVFHEDPFIHISTFGGAEVGCGVAMKVLEVSSDKNFLNHVKEIADIFKVGFEDLKKNHPHTLVGLRQLGMMMGIELTDARLGQVFSKAAFDQGMLAVFAYNDPHVVQFLPPLIIEENLAREILETVDRALFQLEKMIASM